MRPKQRRESGEQDLFRSRLDQIIDADQRHHPVPEFLVVGLPGELHEAAAVPGPVLL